MDKVISIVTTNIDFIALLLVLLGGVFAKHYLSGWNINVAWKTLIVGSVFMSVWAAIQYYTGQLHKADLSKLFFTYCVATSLYELLLKYALDFLSKKFGISV